VPEIPRNSRSMRLILLRRFHFLTRPFFSLFI
jgi:hypothetical protein